MPLLVNLNSIEMEPFLQIHYICFSHHGYTCCSYLIVAIIRLYTEL